MTSAEWQKAFYSAPKVYWLEIKIDGQYEPTGSLYDSEEALQYEIDWRNKKGDKYKVQASHVHNTKLAKSRWQ